MPPRWFLAVANGEPQSRGAAQRLHLDASSPKSLYIHFPPRARISLDTRTKIANFNVEEGAARNKLRQNI